MKTLKYLDTSSLANLLLLIRVAFRRIAIRLFGPRTRFGYVGGHHCGNLGDEVMHECFVRGVAPALLETLETPRVEELLAKAGLSGRDFFHAFILGGGTLVNPIWERKVERLATLGVPFSAIGTGIGNCGKEQTGNVSIDRWTGILQGFDRIAVRGPVSKQRLSDIGIAATVCGDVALRMFKETKVRRERMRVAINVLADPETLDTLRNILGKLLPTLQNRGYAIEGWVINDDDLALTNESLKPYGQDIYTLKTFSDLATRSRQVDFSICARLHGAVLSIAAGTPSLLLGYRDKCEDFARSIDSIETYVSLHAPNCISQSEETLNRFINHQTRHEIWEHTSQGCIALKHALDTEFENLAKGNL